MSDYKSRMLTLKYIILSSCFIISFKIRSQLAFEEHEDQLDFHHDRVVKDNEPLPKDKILLKDVKTLSFQRNKRTTSRRTHSIHQLSCVGGTAGCRLFTPNVSSLFSSYWIKSVLKEYHH